MPARSTITPELYDSLLVAYRGTPGNASNAAREAGCGRDVAKRAWEKGWPKYEYAKPIREVLRSEINQAKADRLRLRQADEQRQDQARDKARQDSIDTLREEGLGAQAARRNALATAGIVAHLVRGLDPLTKRLVESLKTEELKPLQVVRLITDVVQAVKQGNDAIRVAFDLERIRLGEPTQVLGLAHSEELSTEEAVAELLGIQRTLHRAQLQPIRYGAHRTLPNGTTVIDLPTDAFEEDPAKIIDFPRKAVGEGEKR